MAENRPIARFGTPSWFFLAVCGAAFVVQLNPAWRNVLIYDRAALGGGELWRAWTGHIVHFGWPHFVADAGLFLILGWLVGRRLLWLGSVALLVQPPFISAVIYWLDPEMVRFAGLSAVNLGLLLLLAVIGWEGNRSNWFWSTIILIYVVELAFEVVKGGQGGGFIRFDEPGIKVATSAHLAATAYAVLACGLIWLYQRWRRVRNSCSSCSNSPDG